MRKRTKRKVWPLRDPIRHAIEGAQSFNAVGDAATTVHIKNHGAMHALTTGTATRADLQVLTNVLNMAIALAKQGFARSHMPDFDAASDAIKALVARAKVRNRILGTGPELQALNFLLRVHEAQLEVVSVSEIEKATRYVRNCVASGGSEALNLREVYEKP